MQKVLLFVFTLNLSMANAAADRLAVPELMQLRLQGYQLITELLQSYNPNIERNRLTRSSFFESGKYQGWRRTLSSLNEPRINRELEVFYRSMQEIDGISSNQISMLPTLLNPVLQAQSRIDGYLQERISRLDQGENGVDLLNRQLIDIVRFGLYYQTKIFSGLMVFSGKADGDLLVDLDADIRRQFKQLSLIQLAEGSQIERSKTHYEFVSHSILESRSGWIPDGAMYYLSKSIDALLTSAGYSASQGKSRLLVAPGSSDQAKL